MLIFRRATGNTSCITIYNYEDGRIYFAGREIELPDADITRCFAAMMTVSASKRQPYDK